MSLSADDIGGLEIRVRVHADRLRREAAGFDSGSDAMIAHGRLMRKDADALDTVADLLVGLMGGWSSIGPQVRASYQAVQLEYERRKAAVEAAKAEDRAA